MTELSTKHQVFLQAYIACLNATAAYQVAYPDASYETAMANGWALLRKTEIREAIKQFVSEHAIEATEVLYRLTRIARGDLSDFLTIDDKGNAKIDMRKARELGQGGLLKKFTQTKRRGGGDA